MNHICSNSQKFYKVVKNRTKIFLAQESPLNNGVKILKFPQPLPLCWTLLCDLCDHTSPILVYNFDYLYHT